MPKFRPQRAGRASQRKSNLEEVAEDSLERAPSAEPRDSKLQSKRASAPVYRAPDKDDRAQSPDECVVLLSNEQPSEDTEPEHGDNMPRSLSQKGRGRLQRQDESVV